MTHALETQGEPAVTLIPKTPQEAAKALLVIAVTLFAFVRGALADGFSPVEGLQFVIQAVTLIPVFLLAGVMVKTIAAFALAGLQALVVPFSVLVGWQDWGAVTFDDWAGAILAAFLAVGIAVIPNAPPKLATKAGDTYNITALPEAQVAALVDALPVATMEYAGAQGELPDPNPDPGSQAGPRN